MAEKLTVLIPAKNERRNLRLCVDSMRAIAEEILVADSGSSDGTQELARRLGCRVIERELVDFSNFKNWAIPQARHSWVLIVDADERITPALADEIRQTLASPPTDIGAYWIYRDTYFLGHKLRFGDCRNDRVLRLLRRDSCRYTSRRVHEELAVLAHAPTVNSTSSAQSSNRIGTLRRRMLH